MRSSLARRLVARCAVVVALILARAAPLQAQSTQVHVCYAPLVGLMYLIKEPGLAQSCLSIGGVQHVAVSWDKVGPTGDKGPPGPAGPRSALTAQSETKVPQVRPAHRAWWEIKESPVRRPLPASAVKR